MRNDQPFIIKKIKKAGHAHHGGAWKIAYADFVTAMMAFFLLLWLISMTTPEQKQGLADYFAPPSISPSTSGAGGVMGGTALDSTGEKMAGSSSDVAKAVTASPDNQTGEEEAAIGGRAGQAGTEMDASESSRTNLSSSEDQVFHSAAASIRQAWQAMPDITEIADNLVIEETKEGLNIQLIDQEGRPMFPEGSKYPFEATRKAIAAIAPVLQQLPNQISISGHTAAGSRYDNPRYGAWELSSDRANVTRAILSEFGLRDDRIDAVTGKATAEPFFPNDPYLAANERIKIVVLYQAPPVPAGMKP
ncbi:MAG: flagellar motor protein MotB [Candidatus Methylacidiphilales bacterium]|nr:flagellar motor protein MotB [Candidatus Methylacidiphilales bacterium]